MVKRSFRFYNAGKAASEEKPAQKPRFYEADDAPKAQQKSKKQQLTKLRSSITPGTVLILLAGRFRGKRVIFLKQLEKSGLLLVTGPYKINGVPLRRVNQSYVIATSTKVDVSGVKVPEHVDDRYFSERVQGEKEGEEEFFSQQPVTVNQEWLTKRKEDQKAVDTAVLKAVNKVDSLKHYLNAKFSLKKGQAPHLLKF